MSLIWKYFSSQVTRALTGSRPSTSNQTSTEDNLQNSRYEYDVFISFRGTDTRNTFVGHLYANLIRKGIFVFKDDTQLQKGESISSQLVHAIQHSRISIIVFSKDYPCSTWCLDEMLAIAHAHFHDEIKQIVCPVFYDVDPSHVRKQNGAYEGAFVFHSLQFKHDPDKVDVWKRYMTYLASLAGWDVRDKPEFEQIQNIVQVIIENLGRKFLGIADELIGIQPRVKILENVLKLSSRGDEFRVLGIWGMDGIGKTTLATVLFDTISHHYQFGACCFIENVSTIYRDGGAIAVQKQILRQTLKEKNLETYTSSDISGIILNRLYNMKLLIVLDDVDQFEQLQELHINPKLLLPGSRIIITTRDVHILELYGADRIHKVELMNDNDARELLCRKAFRNDNPSSDYAELIPKVLKYAQGLPLAIRVLGSFLYNRNTSQWRATLEGLENNPDSGIMKVLQSSFEGLEQREREIFLHVACFFDGEREDYVRRILDACGLQPDIGISLIAEKSFITIRNQEIHMHKMLQELGKKSVREQHPDEPRLWSRLWLYSDLYDVMTTKPESMKAKAIILNQKKDVCDFNPLRDEDLSKMKNLKVLILYHSNFPGSLKFLSDSLCYLLWNGYPFTSLPSNFQPYNLVEFNMPGSNIEQLWIGIQEPLQFRCGFDIVLPWHEETNGSRRNLSIQNFFSHSFKGGSIRRINNTAMHADWLGFLFYVTFELKSDHALSSSSLSSPPLPYPIYLSFESDHTEERFDMLLSLDQSLYGNNYVWIIYISRKHCHFVKTGANITFKTHKGLILKEWGLRVITNGDINGSRIEMSAPLPLQIVKVKQSGSGSRVEPKIQLPYNWLVSDEDEAEMDGAKRKETSLFNLGLSTEIPH